MDEGVKSSQNLVLLVGVGGPSGTGKSSLASLLAEALQSPVEPITMDSYFMPWQMPHVPGFGKNWELPENIDLPSFQKDLLRVLGTLSHCSEVPRTLQVTRSGENIVRREFAGRPLRSDAPVFVIVEGFLLFYFVELAPLFDVALWIECPRDVCLNRRFHRNSHGMSRKTFTRWYHALVWKYFLVHRPIQVRNVPEALHLDGEFALNVSLTRAMEHCQSIAQERALGSVVPPTLPSDL